MPNKKEKKQKKKQKPGKRPAARLTEAELRKVLRPPDRRGVIEVRNPKKQKTPSKLRLRPGMAFSPPEPELPEGFARIGGVPLKKTDDVPLLPAIEEVRRVLPVRRWARDDWRAWGDFTLVDPCRSVPAKSSRVEIPVLGPTRLCHVSKDCARVYTVDELGRGSVVNVITEGIEDCFLVSPDPAAAHPVPDPIVNPFTKGGINHRFKRLYVPASFHTQFRTGTTGGFYVAVVDVDPASGSYLDTIDYIPCGWIPEEVAFTDDGEIGVIANYMQGTATIFQASDGSILAAELDGFPGAGGAAAGGAWARSVRCANVPGLGNRAFLTLTDEGASIPGVAIFDLDSPGFPRSNFTDAAFDFVDGVALTPDKRRILLVESSQLHVVKVDVDPPVLERSIALPTGGGQRYFGGIAVRPSGDLVFLATGQSDPGSPTQGTSLTMVNYVTGTVVEMPNGIAPQTWGLSIHSFGNPLKPYIFVCSLSGRLTIIPC